MKIDAAIYSSDSINEGNGWKVVCESEALPHSYTDDFDHDKPVVLLEENIPAGLESYLRSGGTALITNVKPQSLPGERDYCGRGIITQASFSSLEIEQIRMPAIVNIFRGEGWGQYNIHENRVTKNTLHNDQFSLILEETWGKGKIIYTGAPLTGLLTVTGDTLRNFNPNTPVTERVATVDKAKIERILIWMLRRGFSSTEVPYCHYWYFPEGAPSVFNFRIDVDGAHREKVVDISKTAKQENLKLNYYINKNKCSGEEYYLKRINNFHEIGCHADLHNLFNRVSENIHNIENCERWLKEYNFKYKKGFVAPRGMWNFALNKALEKLGFEYSSDFSLKFDGLPFFPRPEGERSSVLQLPVHPFSVERAQKYYKNTAKDNISAREIRDYFLSVIFSKAKHNSPILLYSHPENFGDVVDQVLPDLVDMVNQLDIPKMTLGDFSDWWKKRDKLPLNLLYEAKDDILTVESEIPKNFRLQVISSEKTEIDGSIPDNKIIRRSYQ